MPSSNTQDPQNLKDAPDPIREQLTQRGGEIITDFINEIARTDPELADQYRAVIGDPQNAAQSLLSSRITNGYLAASLEDIQNTTNQMRASDESRARMIQYLELQSGDPKSGIAAIFNSSGNEYYKQVMQGKKSTAEQFVAEQKYWGIEENKRTATASVPLVADPQTDTRILSPESAAANLRTPEEQYKHQMHQSALEAMRAKVQAGEVSSVSMGKNDVRITFSGQEGELKALQQTFEKDGIQTVYEQSPEGNPRLIVRKNSIDDAQDMIQEVRGSVVDVGEYTKRAYEAARSLMNEEGQKQYLPDLEGYRTLKNQIAKDPQLAESIKTNRLGEKLAATEQLLNALRRESPNLNDPDAIASVVEKNVDPGLLKNPPRSQVDKPVANAPEAPDDIRARNRDRALNAALDKMSPQEAGQYMRPEEYRDALAMAENDPGFKRSLSTSNRGVPVSFRSTETLLSQLRGVDVNDPAALAQAVDNANRITKDVQRYTAALEQMTESQRERFQDVETFKKTQEITTKAPEASRLMSHSDKPSAAKLRASQMLLEQLDGVNPNDRQAVGDAARIVTDTLENYSSPEPARQARVPSLQDMLAMKNDTGELHYANSSKGTSIGVTGNNNQLMAMAKQFADNGIKTSFSTLEDGRNMLRVRTESMNDAAAFLPKDTQGNVKPIKQSKPISQFQPMSLTSLLAMTTNKDNVNFISTGDSLALRFSGDDATLNVMAENLEAQGIKTKRGSLNGETFIWVHPDHNGTVIDALPEKAWEGANERNKNRTTSIPEPKQKNTSPSRPRRNAQGSLGGGHGFDGNRHSSRNTMGRGGEDEQAADPMRNRRDETLDDVRERIQKENQRKTIATQTETNEPRVTPGTDTGLRSPNFSSADNISETQRKNPVSPPTPSGDTTLSRPLSADGFAPRAGYRTQGVTGGSMAGLGLAKGGYAALRTLAKEGFSKDFMVYAAGASYDAADLASSTMQAVGRNTGLAGQNISRAGPAVQAFTSLYSVSQEDGLDHKLQRAYAEMATMGSGYAAGTFLGAAGSRTLGAVGGVVLGAAGGFGVGLAASYVAQNAIEITRMYEKEDDRFEGVDRDNMSKFRALSVKMAYLANGNKRIKTKEGGGLDLTDEYTREQVMKEVDREIISAEAAKNRNDSWVPRWARRDFESLGEYNSAVSDLAILKTAKEEGLTPYSQYLQREEALASVKSLDGQMQQAMEKGDLKSLVQLSDEKIDSLNLLAATTRNNNVRKEVQEQTKLTRMQKSSYEMMSQMSDLTTDGVLPPVNFDHYQELNEKLAKNYDAMAAQYPDVVRFRGDMRRDDPKSYYEYLAKTTRTQGQAIKLTEMEYNIAEMEKGGITPGEQDTYAKTVASAAQMSKNMLEARYGKLGLNVMNFDQSVEEYRDAMTKAGFGEAVEANVAHFAYGKALYDRSQQLANKQNNIENGTYLAEIDKSNNDRMQNLRELDGMTEAGLNSLRNTFNTSRLLTSEDRQKLDALETSSEIVMTKQAYADAKKEYENLQQQKNAPSNEALQIAEMNMLEAKVAAQRTEGQVLMQGMSIIENRLDAVTQDNQAMLDGITQQAGPNATEALQARMSDRNAAIANKYNLDQLNVLVDSNSSEAQRKQALQELADKGVDTDSLTLQDMRNQYTQARQEMAASDQGILQQRQMKLRDFASPDARKGRVAAMFGGLSEVETQELLIINSANGTSYQMTEREVSGQQAIDMAEQLNKLGTSDKPAFKVVQNDFNQPVLAVDTSRLNVQQFNALMDMSGQFGNSDAPASSVADKTPGQPQDKMAEATANLKGMGLSGNALNDVLDIMKRPSSAEVALSGDDAVAVSIPRNAQNSSRFLS